MKILFVCHRFPYPPQRGGKIRPFNIIKHLNKSHDVTVASLTRSPEEAKNGKGLGNYCNKYFMGNMTLFLAFMNILKNLPFLKPFSMGYFYSKVLNENVQKELLDNQYDLIIVHCSSVGQYVEDIASVPKIMDFGDMDSQKWLIYSKIRKFPLNLVYLYEGVTLERFEKILSKKFSLSTCTTLLEKKTLDSYQTANATDWFPNGVDTDYFKPSGQAYEADTLCFLGRMDYYPNQECIIDFCNNTLPLIKEKRPKVKLFIIGAEPSRKILSLSHIPGVTVTGTVDDVRGYIQKCAVNIAPLNIARGTQNKILESLAMGVPVVSSEIAAGGVDAVPGEHFLTGGTHREFADSVLRLLENPEERDLFAKAGRERMITNHNWESSMERLDAIIEKCMNNSKTR